MTWIAHVVTSASLQWSCREFLLPTLSSESHPSWVHKADGISAPPKALLRVDKHASWGQEGPSAESPYSRVVQSAQRWGLPSEALASLHPFISPQVNAINQRGQSQYRKNTPGGKSRPGKEEGGDWDVAPFPLSCSCVGAGAGVDGECQLMLWGLVGKRPNNTSDYPSQYFCLPILRDHGVLPRNVLTWGTGQITLSVSNSDRSNFPCSCNPTQQPSSLLTLDAGSSDRNGY